MKIGIDARFLTHPQRGGFKTYTENLIHSIAEIDKENRYFIYLDREPSKNLLPDQSNLVIRVVSGNIPLIGMPVREQFSLARQARRDRVDIFHFLCNTSSIHMPGKKVITLHDTIQIHNTASLKLTSKFADYKNWLISEYSRQSILRTASVADRVITVSDYERSVISRELKIPLERISVTHLAPDPVFTRLSKENRSLHRDNIAKRLSIHRKFLLGVGYEPRKNIPLLIESFSKIVQYFPDLDLVIVCANEQYRMLFNQLLDKMHLNDRVIILGSLPLDELTVLYNLAEAFVFPSERESFGLPPLEAIACGTPTIAMKMSSLPEILADGALFVDTKEPQAWAGAIQQLLTDDALRQELIARGVRRASEFSWHKCARETIQVYQQVINEQDKSYSRRWVHK